MRLNRSNEIAKERLIMMDETVSFEDTPNLARKMQREIADIVARYYEISPEDYEIKVVLKHNKEKGIRC